MVNVFVENDNLKNTQSRGAKLLEFRGFTCRENPEQCFDLWSISSSKNLLVLRSSVCEARSCGRERAFVDVEEMVVDNKETCRDTATCLAYMKLDLPRRAAQPQVSPSECLLMTREQTMTRVMTEVPKQGAQIVYIHVLVSLAWALNAKQLSVCMTFIPIFLHSMSMRRLRY